MTGNLMGVKGMVAVAMVCMIAGCASPRQEQIVMVGPDTYMIGLQGDSADTADAADPSASGARARLLQRAELFCKGQGRQTQPIGNAARGSAIGAYAPAEVQFKCVQVAIQRKDN